MATYPWVSPPAEAITGQTKIKEADNKITNIIANLVEWTNGTGVWAAGGMQQSMEESVDAYLSDVATVEW